jgi:hypothetical protein
MAAFEELSGGVISRRRDASAQVSTVTIWDANWCDAAEASKGKTTVAEVSRAHDPPPLVGLRRVLLDVKKLGLLKISPEVRAKKYFAQDVAKILPR